MSKSFAKSLPFTTVKVPPINLYMSPPKENKTKQKINSDPFKMTVNFGFATI